jgi:hypothetical protein
MAVIARADAGSRPATTSQTQRLQPVPSRFTLGAGERGGSGREHADVRVAAAGDTSTFPLGSKVAVWSPQAVISDPVALQVPVAGLKQLRARQRVAVRVRAAGHQHLPAGQQGRGAI